MIVVADGSVVCKINTIEQTQQRKLLNTTHEFGEFLIQSEYEEIMEVYQRAITRMTTEI